MTFSETEGDQLKLAGMELAADNNKDRLALARHVAESIGLETGECTADAVGKKLKSLYGIETLGPAAGSIFKTSRWRWSGEFVKSSRVSNHSRLLRVWKYVG